MSRLAPPFVPLAASICPEIPSGGLGQRPSGGQTAPLPLSPKRAEGGLA